MEDIQRAGEAAAVPPDQMAKLLAELERLDRERVKELFLRSSRGEE